jgi:hypothetical protein
MEQGELESERAKMQNRLLDLQVGDEYDPMRRFRREAPVRAAGFQEGLERLPQEADVRRGITTQDYEAGEAAKFGTEQLYGPARDEMALDLMRRQGDVSTETLIDRTTRLGKLGYDPSGRPLREGGGGGGGATMKPTDVDRILKRYTAGSEDAFSAIDIHTMSSAIASGNPEWAGAYADGIKFMNSPDMKDELEAIKDLPDEYPYSFVSEEGPQQVPWRQYYNYLFMAKRPGAEVKAFVDDLISQINAEQRGARRKEREGRKAESDELMKRYGKPNILLGGKA